MNIGLLHLCMRWIEIICLSLFSLSSGASNISTISINNKSINKTSNVISTVVEYGTVKKYNSKLPMGRTNVIVEGKDGLSYAKNGQQTSLRDAVDEVLEIGTGLSGDYNGNTTGYGGDCKGCSGNVSCRTREGEKFNLINDGVYYDDNQFGSVRIIAADQRIFKCGTVIEIDNGKSEPFLGIVMDTGHDIKSNWDKYQLVHVDIAYETEKDPAVYSATSKDAKFNVQRWGW